MTLVTRTIWLTAAALLLAGCGSDPAPTAAPTPTTTSDTRPACAADAGGEMVAATTTTGFTVDMLLLGSGEDGVALLPQDDGDICQWLAFGQELAQTYRVALVEWAEPRPEVPALAVAALRDAGSQDVVLGGASYGGATVMSEAHGVDPAPAGVFSLGGELRLPGHDFRPGIAQWDGPLLEISSEEDHYFDSADAAKLRTLHPGPETILMLPGGTHGVDLLDGAGQDQVRAAIEDFLAQTLG